MSEHHVVILLSLPSSVIRFRLELLHQLLEEGYSITCIGPEPDSETAEALEGLGVDYREVTLKRQIISPVADILYFLGLVSLLVRLKPSLTFCYTLKPIVYGSLAAFLCHVPGRVSMITGLGWMFASDTSKAKSLRYLILLLYRFAIRANQLVFFQNAEDEQYFRVKAVLGTSTAVRVVRGSGVNTQVYRYSPPNLDTVVFLMVARLLKSKGIQEFAEAAITLKSRYPNAAFRVVGSFDEGHPDSVTPEEIEAIESKDAVRFWGWTNDVRKELQNCSVFVLPSYREGLPRSVLEAMSVGRAIVTCDVPGCRETVQEGENGFLVSPRDAVALSKAMEKFLKHPDWIVQMGQKSRQVCVSSFESSTIAQSMVSAINSTL